MALAPISAAVSVVSGVAGLVSKQKQASEQRKQLDIQAQQNYDSTLATMRSMQLTQAQAEREYALSDLQFRQGVMQQETALRTQSLLADIETQRQRSLLAQQQVQAEAATQQQLDQLARQTVGVKSGASSSRQQSDLASAQVAEQAQGSAAQVEKAMTQQEAQAALQLAMNEGRSSSGREQIAAANLRSITAALSADLDIDSSLLTSQLQRMSERDLANIAEQLALDDVDFSRSNVQSRKEMSDLALQGAGQTLEFNLGQQQRALEDVGKQLALTSDMRNVQEQSARDTERANYQLMQESASKTGNANAASLQSQRRSVSGVNVLDVAATGLNAYNAVSPLIQRPTQNSNSSFVGAPSYIPGVAKPDVTGTYGPPSYMPGYQPLDNFGKAGPPNYTPVRYSRGL